MLDTLNSWDTEGKLKILRIKNRFGTNWKSPLGYRDILFNVCLGAGNEFVMELQVYHKEFHNIRTGFAFFFCFEGCVLFLGLQCLCFMYVFC